MPSVASWHTTSSNAADNHFLSLTTDARPTARATTTTTTHPRRQSQQSSLAKFAMQSSTHLHHDGPTRPSNETSTGDERLLDQLSHHLDRTFANGYARHNGTTYSKSPPLPSSAFEFRPPPSNAQPRSTPSTTVTSPSDTASTTMAMNDTPESSAPTSPHLNGSRSFAGEGATFLALGAPSRLTSSGSSTPRIRPTTLDIPGLTKSKVSPDGKIAKRDVGAKLVIVMVGLPARGKSYITKKLARYLNWLQHDTKIFNVGERRRVAAGGPHSQDRLRLRHSHSSFAPVIDQLNLDSPSLPDRASATQILLNDETQIEAPAATQSPTQVSAGQLNGTGHRVVHEEERDLYQPDMGEPSSPRLSRSKTVGDEVVDQSAAFFDPENQKASQIREQLARETLDELLDYILDQNGSVGILDATNSTLDRRKMVMDRIRERAGPDLNVLFLESRCVDRELLEANMRLKLSGPDYKDMDPTIALADFKKRVQAYEKAYVPLGDYEERHNMPYIQMIDVGRKVISHQIKGFLMAQANYYLLNFNLAPRQIWITRHGLSMDNVSGKIGGDSHLAPEGHQYAKTLVKFMDMMRKEWDMKQLLSHAHSHFPPQPGDVTPPNPYYQALHYPASCTSDGNSSTSGSTDGHEFSVPAFCVWTSMLNRSIETAQYFNDEEYDVKQMRMLDELNAGTMEGLTYSSISTQYPEEYSRRRQNKLHYRYPGPGGEGYLDIINRLRPVIMELERMTDNVLLIGHRSVARVLLAYFKGLKREEVAELDVPIGMLYCLEPKPYGVDFKAYKWDKGTEWFYEQEDFALKAAEDDMQ